MEYHCDDCGMSVKGLTCGECDAPLEHDTIKDDHGKLIEVSKCPNGCGMIKSPMCCDHDMQVN